MIRSMHGLDTWSFAFKTSTRLIESTNTTSEAHYTWSASINIASNVTSEAHYTWPASTNTWRDFRSPLYMTSLHFTYQAHWVYKHNMTLEAHYTLSASTNTTWPWKLIVHGQLSPQLSKYGPYSSASLADNRIRRGIQLMCMKHYLRLLSTF